MRLYDITTGTGDFIANGVVSHNCFARPTHTYLDFDAGRDFEREIVVKVNAPEVLRVELARPSWKGEHVAMGTNTDPYQWVEGRYKLMRGIWEALRDAANPCSVLTKSPLLLRDLDLMREIAAVTAFSAEPLGAHDRREGMAGQRAAHAEPTRAARGRGRAQPRRHPDRRPGRTAHARHQRRPGAGATRSSSWPPRRARRESAASRCTCAARCARSSWSGCGPIGRTWSSTTSSSMHAARTRHRQSRSAWRARPARPRHAHGRRLPARARPRRRAADAAAGIAGASAAPRAAGARADDALLSERRRRGRPHL